MEKADDDPFQTEPVRQDQGSHAHLARGEAGGKMLEALDLQMEAAKVTLDGETYIRRPMRWVKDPETGERVNCLVFDLPNPLSRHPIPFGNFLKRLTPITFETEATVRGADRGVFAGWRQIW